MAVEQEISVKGAVTYWNLSESDPNVIKEAWKKVGLEKFAPNPRTNYEALKHALHQVYSDHTHMVRPLKDAAGWAVISESKGADARTLTHEQEFAVIIGADGNLQFDATVAKVRAGIPTQKIDDIYHGSLGSVPALKVSRAIVALLDTALHATALRGGIYWVPEDKIDTWKTVAEGIEQAGNQSTVYIMRTAMDDTAKKAVLDALTADIEKEVASILADTTAGANLGARALSSRKTKAEELFARVEEYEKILDVKLQTLRTKAKEADAAATLAALAAMQEEEAA